MSDRYPKSREELADEVASLRQQLAASEHALLVAAELVKSMEQEVASLRRRMRVRPQPLDRDAEDAFRRPAFSR